MILRVVLRAHGGEPLADPPGRDLLVTSAHSFADLAAAIDRAFARWDVSHLHEFRLPGGRRIGMVDDEFGDREDELDEITTTLAKLGLKIGDAFEYTFDLSDGWEHVCMVLREDIDPQEESGIVSLKVVPVFGWGTIPDQYGRVTPESEEPLEG